MPITRILNQPLQFLTEAEIEAKDCSNCISSNYRQMYEPDDYLMAQFQVEPCDETNIACDPYFGVGLFEDVEQTENPGWQNDPTTNGWTILSANLLQIIHFASPSLANRSLRFNVTNFVSNPPALGYYAISKDFTLPAADYNNVFEVKFIAECNNHSVTFAYQVYVDGVLQFGAGAVNNIDLYQILPIRPQSANDTFNLEIRITPNGSTGASDRIDLHDFSVVPVSECWTYASDWRQVLGGGYAYEQSYLAHPSDAVNTSITYTGTNLIEGRYYQVIISAEIESGMIQIENGTNLFDITETGETTINFKRENAAFRIKPVAFIGKLYSITIIAYELPELRLIKVDGDTETELNDLADGFVFFNQDRYNLKAKLNEIYTDDEQQDLLEYGCYKIRAFMACVTEGMDIEEINTAIDPTFDAESWNISITGDDNSIEYATGDIQALYAESGTATISGQNADPFVNGREYHVEMNVQMPDTYNYTIKLGGVTQKTGTINNLVGLFEVDFITAGINESNDLTNTDIVIQIQSTGGALLIEDIYVAFYNEAQPENYYYSNVFNYRESFGCTKLVEAYTEGEAVGFVFDDNFKLSQRLICEFVRPTYPIDGDDSMDSTGRHRKDYNVRMKQKQLFFNPVPELVHDVISTQMMLDNFEVNSVRHIVKTDDYTPEWNNNTLKDIAPSRISLYSETEGLFFRRQ
jgi:hypothetical protein